MKQNLPIRLSGETELSSDVVEIGGEYYRLIKDDHTGCLWLCRVTADVVTSAFFGQIHQLDWEDLMVEVR